MLSGELTKWQKYTDVLLNLWFMFRFHKHIADSYKMFMRIASGLHVPPSEAAEKMCVFNSKYEIFSKDYNLIFIAWTPAKTDPFLSSNKYSQYCCHCRKMSLSSRLKILNNLTAKLTVLTLIRSQELLNILLSRLRSWSRADASPGQAKTRKMMSGKIRGSQLGKEDYRASSWIDSSELRTF